MKCLRCGFANDTDSKFCEECGNQLEHVTPRNKSSRVGQKSQTHTMSRQISDVEDVIFKPKHKPIAWGNVFGAILLVLIGGFFFLVWLGSDDTGTSTATDSTYTEQTSFPITYLTINNQDLKWIGEELYFIGTLHNKYTEAVKSTYVRLDFYKDKALTKLIDTRLVDVGGTLPSGAFSFQVPVNFYQNDQYWWTWKVMEAEGF